MTRVQPATPRPRDALPRPRRPGGTLPRTLHPIAWWGWAIALAVAVSRTTNPLLLVLALGVLGVVVAARRTEAPWARAFRYYLLLTAVVVALRVLFRVIFTGPAVPSDHVLLHLPVVHLPHLFAGIGVGGPVTAEALVGASVDGLRLGVLLCCIGAANVLADPKRALRSLPGALYELGVTVTVAVTVAPQLVESVQRVRRARRLRGGAGRGVRAVRSIAVPVLEDALERSLRLAAAMDSRGYGRSGPVGPRRRRVTAGLMLAGLLGLCLGAYGLTAASAPAVLGLPTALGGAVVCAGGLVLGGRRVSRSRYRPDPWTTPEWLVLGSGVAAAVLVGLGGAGLDPSLSPLAWPPLPLLPVVGLLLAALPAVAAPPPPAPAVRGAAARPAADPVPRAVAA